MKEVRLSRLAGEAPATRSLRLLLAFKQPIRFKGF